MMKFINNVGDYFSTNYFGDDFVKEVVQKTGFSVDDQKALEKQVAALKEKYFRYKRTILEGRLRTKDKVTETCAFHTEVLKALGYDADKNDYQNLFLLDEKSVLPIRNTLYRDVQPHLMIMEMHTLIPQGEEEPDGLLEQQYHHIDDETTQVPPQKYHRSQWSNVFKVPEGVQISPMVINKAVSRLFLLDAHRRPRYILLCAGNIYFLLEQEKWFRGSYLEFHLESLFDEAAIKRDYYSLFYALLAKETLAPQSEIVLMEQLNEESHKKAYEVTQDLKEGVIHAVETIANEAVYYLKNRGEDLKDLNADTLKNECLNYVYRLLFLFYAESRQDLDILPANDEVYLQGYSLEMLRDLEQTPLNTASSQNGFFFHESLSKLFTLLSSGYREMDNANRSFKIRHLDSPLFNDDLLEILPRTKLRNSIWQDIICQLSLSKKQKGKARGRISYANLGINQLGSVYESLLAFRGFFAESDYIEVHRKLKDKENSQKVARTDGSYLVPRHRLDDFDLKEVYHDSHDEMRIIKEGTFIYRLSGRDRQKSASYYTPEVLTQCTVKYTLKPILEKLDKGEIKALDLLKLKILEPAMGAAAFHNEVINQLAEAYLQYRQEEIKKIRKDWRVEPDKYREELQKVKAFIALRNVYGVDLNPTAVELGKLSLWLNVIHKDMQTPFFGYRLGTGNAVVGSWLKVYDVASIHLNLNKPKEKKEWWTKAPKHLSFKAKGIQRKENEIYHFLLPDKGMVPSAGIDLLKVEFKNECKKVSDWKKDFCAPLDAAEVNVVQKISAKIDALLEEHYVYQSQIAKETQVGIHIFGTDDVVTTGKLDLRSYEAKEALANQRTHQNAPYYKLKMIMDYWCSLWFWDVREAKDLPTRQDWYSDLMYILDYELTGKESIDDLKNYRKQEQKQKASQELADYAVNTSLFDNNRLQLVKKYAEMYKFFHYQLEFIEVFRERGGFDVIVGNPPWVKINFDIKSFYGDYDPKVIIDDLSASAISSELNKSLFGNRFLAENYISEDTYYTSVKTYFNSLVNFEYSEGKNNLYKLVLENALNLSQGGIIGLVVDEGIFSDNTLGEFRAKLFQRVKFLFRFNNELKLFSEVGNAKKYEIIVLKSASENIEFSIISNLYHPITIDQSMIVEKFQILGIKNELGYWQLKGNKRRVIRINEGVLKAIHGLFDSSAKNYLHVRLPLLHDVSSLKILEKVSNSEEKVKDIKGVLSSQMINETNCLKDGTIQRLGQYVPKKNFVFSGPHYYVGTPFNKNPNKGCKNHRDYTDINLCEISEDYIPRTVFKLIKNLDTPGSYYHIHRRRALNTNERTLIGAIVPPGYPHTNNSISIQFPTQLETIVFSCYSYSIIFDYLIRLTGSGDIWFSVVGNLPYIKQPDYKIIHRGLRLNCISKDYESLWNSFVNKFDQSDFLNMSIYNFPTWTFEKWNYSTPVRNALSRRQALIEIDVLVTIVNCDLLKMGILHRKTILIHCCLSVKLIIDLPGRILRRCLGGQSET